MLGSLVPVRHPDEYEQSTIANFCFGLALAAASVDAPIRKPTVTMTPQFWLMNVLMFLAESYVEVEGRYVTVILPPLADAAACMPSQEDWLNDLSLMPPVSVTMQPLNEGVVVVVDVELG